MAMKTFSLRLTDAEAQMLTELAEHHGVPKYRILTRVIQHMAATKGVKRVRDGKDGIGSMVNYSVKVNMHDPQYYAGLQKYQKFLSSDIFPVSFETAAKIAICSTLARRGFIEHGGDFFDEMDRDHPDRPPCTVQSLTQE